MNDAQIAWGVGTVEGADSDLAGRAPTPGVPVLVVGVPGLVAGVPGLVAGVPGLVAGVPVCITEAGGCQRTRPTGTPNPLPRRVVDATAEERNPLDA